VRIGRIEIPIRYWMFALRERDVDQLAAHLARAANDTGLPNASQETLSSI
jgi:hypothetical protein